MRPKGHDKNIGTNQAVNSDNDKSGYNKGHLYPVLHTDSELSMLATSTLTNAAPQNSTFNLNAWRAHERAVDEDLKSCDKEAYVVTGVVPDTTHTINNRVTVSKYYWRATCCLKNNQYIEKGYCGPDESGKVRSLSIAELEKKLQVFYHVNIPFQFSKTKIINHHRNNPEHENTNN